MIFQLYVFFNIRFWRSIWLQSSTFSSSVTFSLTLSSIALIESLLHQNILVKSREKTNVVSFYQANDNLEWQVQNISKKNPSNSLENLSFKKSSIEILSWQRFHLYFFKPYFHSEQQNHCFENWNGKAGLHRINECWKRKNEMNSHQERTKYAITSRTSIAYTANSGNRISISTSDFQTPLKILCATQTVSHPSYYFTMHPWSSSTSTQLSRPIPCRSLLASINTRLFSNQQRPRSTSSTKSTFRFRCHTYLDH